MVSGYLDRCVERINFVEALGILSNREQGLLSLVYLHLEVFFEISYHMVLKKLPLNKSKGPFQG